MVGVAATTCSRPFLLAVLTDFLLSRPGISHGLFLQGGHFLVADTTPLGLKGLECAKLLLTQAKVSHNYYSFGRCVSWDEVNISLDSSDFDPGQLDVTENRRQQPLKHRKTKICTQSITATAAAGV